MAKRYGGEFSPKPGAATRTEGRGEVRADAPRSPLEGYRRAPMAARTRLLALLGGLSALPAFWSGPVDLALHLVAAGALVFSAWMTREGAKAQAEYDERPTARRPAVPRKLIGTAATALGLGALGATHADPLAAPILGVMGGILHFAAFGPDPLRNKLAAGADVHQSDRVARMVDEAEAALAHMQAQIDGLNERALSDRMARFAGAARRLFRQVEADPRDLTAARKYLGVYLRGARDATDKFVAYYARSKDESARADYLTLLDDLEGGFAQRTEKLMLDDRTGMDIEIDVLKGRLRREGVQVESDP